MSLRAPGTRLSHLPALDGLRGLAILMVMAFHFTILPWDSTDVLERLWVSLSLLGEFGVDLFFVLSGFLITRILLETRDDSGYFRNFYARRALRIFPLYYAFLLFHFNLEPYFADPARYALNPPAASYVAWFLFYLSNWYLPFQWAARIPPELALTWSLAIEEQFYLVWPAVVRRLGPVGLARACAAILVAAPLVRAALAGVPGRAAYLLTPARMDALAAGALCAALAVLPGGLARWLGPARWGAWIAGLAAAALCGLEMAADWKSGAKPEIVLDWPVLVPGLTLLAACFSCVLVVLVAGGERTGLARGFSVRPLRVLGKYSYAIYLLHYPVMRVLSDVVLGGRGLPDVGGSRVPAQALFTVSAGGLTLGLAWLSWRFFESRFLALKDRFPREPGRQN